MSVRPPRLIAIGLIAFGSSAVICLASRLVLAAIVFTGGGERLFLGAWPWLTGIGTGSGTLFLILCVYSLFRYSRVHEQ